MFVTRCVDCNHQELTVNPECSCGCHTPAPQPSQMGRYALLDRIAALEAHLAEAQARLAMAVDALECISARVRPVRVAWDNRDVVGQGTSAEIRVGVCFGDLRKVAEAGGIADNALAATAASVAQHTARVERRGAKAALEAFAERDDWTLDVPRSLVDRIRRLLTAEARAAEVERLDSDKT